MLVLALLSLCLKWKFLFITYPRDIVRRCSKTCLNLLMTRIKLLQNERYAIEANASQFFQAGQEAIARIRVLEQLEGNHLSSAAILSQDGSVWVQL
ncbi:hypothetical protein S245_027153 [Arachis hypogaea]